MHMTKINGKIPARFLVTVLVLSRLIGCTVQALGMKTAANGQQYLWEIRNQDPPISLDEIRQGNKKELGSVSSLVRNFGALMPKVQSQPIGVLPSEVSDEYLTISRQRLAWFLDINHKTGPSGYLTGGLVIIDAHDRSVLRYTAID
ncbi:MAG: hypothetical protein METHP_01873 [Methanoregula sp. SKADARSKE-2]|nr:MAG: hypothetical protein METHP_01873 [Methanoregula sp. SKADARSKE-2]